WVEDTSVEHLATPDPAHAVGATIDAAGTAGNSSGEIAVAGGQRSYVVADADRLGRPVEAIGGDSELPAVPRSDKQAVPVAASPKQGVDQGAVALMPFGAI